MTEYWFNLCCVEHNSTQSSSQASLPHSGTSKGPFYRRGIRVTLLEKQQRQMQQKIVRLSDSRRSIFQTKEGVVTTFESRAEPRYFVDLLKAGVIAGDPGMVYILEEMIVCLKINVSLVKSKPLGFVKKKPFLKTLVLDLDQTLLFATKQVNQFAETINYVNVQTGEQSTLSYKVRPYAQWFIKQAAKLFELVIFTAGSRDYAQPLIAKIDPEGLVSSTFFRESCLSLQLNPPLKNIYNSKTKDLAGLGIPLEDVLIVDNSPFCYIMQPDNAVPILHFRGNPNDRELVSLMDYLVKAYSEPSLLQFNKYFFNLSQYRLFNNPLDLVKTLY